MGRGGRAEQGQSTCARHEVSEEAKPVISLVHHKCCVKALRHGSAFLPNGIELRLLFGQDELHRRWAEAAGQSKASAAWSSSDHLSMAHQQHSIDALHDDPPMSQVQCCPTGSASTIKALAVSKRSGKHCSTRRFESFTKVLTKCVPKH